MRHGDSRMAFGVYVHSDKARIGRWHAFATDGSRQNLPRTLNRELNYGLSTKGAADGAGANVRLWVEGLNQTMAAEWKDGAVWLWPYSKRKHTPLVLRLIRIETTAQASRTKSEIWLVTNVPDESQLTREEASVLCQKRWRANECTFQD